MILIILKSNQKECDLKVTIPKSDLYYNLPNTDMIILFGISNLKSI